MDEFFHWLSGNPTAAIILLVAVSLLVTILAVFFTVALMQGRDVQIWPPKISAETFAIQIGSVDIPAVHATRHELYEFKLPGHRTAVVPVKFVKPFKKTPKVIVGVRKIDLGDYEALKVNRLEVKVQDERLDGFDVVFETWEDSKVWNASACWIAVSE
jgi:hypothetical protein